MSLKDVKPGKYKAKAIKGAWGNVGANNTPAVSVMFEFENNGSKEQIWHKMFLTQTALKNGGTVMEKTFDTLSMLGYDESVELVPDEAGNPTFTTAHLADKEVELVLEYQTDHKDPTKQYIAVKWINEPHGNSFAGKSVKEVLGNVDVRAAMAAARARTGTKKPVAVDTTEIPF